MMTRPVVSALLALGLLWLQQAAAFAAATPPDYDLPGGHFYSQTAGNGLGFVVSDFEDEAGRPARFWSEFRRLGGVATLGYPASNRYRGSDGLLYQAFQAGVLQWRPESRSAVLANAFDMLTAAGADQRLLALGVPLPVGDDGSGGNLQRATQTRLEWLTNESIRTRFYTNPATGARWDTASATQLYGLPTSSPQRLGPFVTQRFQRVAFQSWVDAVPGMPLPGSVTPVLAGDILKQLKLVPEAALPPGPSTVSAAVDKRLRPALALLANYDASAPSSYVQNLAQHTVRLVVGPLPTNALGTFDSRRNSITVAESLVGREPQILAEVLSHESSHALDFWNSVEMNSAQGCYRTEIEAFRHQADVWNFLYPGGRANPVDRVDTLFNEVLAQVKGDPSGFAARLTRAYSHECG